MVTRNIEFRGYFKNTPFVGPDPFAFGEGAGGDNRDHTLLIAFVKAGAAVICGGIVAYGFIKGAEVLGSEWSDAAANFGQSFSLLKFPEGWTGWFPKDWPKMPQIDLLKVFNVDCSKLPEAPAHVMPDFWSPGF